MEDEDKRQSEAYRILLETYISEIRKKFLQTENDAKLGFLSRLETIVKVNIDSTFLFEGSKAKEIRLKNGLSQTKLAKKLDIGSCSTISNYEKGVYNPLRVESKGGRRYLEWLKNEGYN